MLASIAEASHGATLEPAVALAIAEGGRPDTVARLLPEAHPIRPALATLTETARLLALDTETPAILRALDGRFIRPAPGGDLLRTPAILPTGRNVHGFDPFRIPSAVAVKDGARQAARLIARHVADGNPFPRRSRSSSGAPTT